MIRGNDQQLVLYPAVNSDRRTSGEDVGVYRAKIAPDRIVIERGRGFSQDDQPALVWVGSGDGDNLGMCRHSLSELVPLAMGVILSGERSRLGAWFMRDTNRSEANCHCDRYASEPGHMPPDRHGLGRCVIGKLKASYESFHRSEYRRWWRCGALVGVAGGVVRGGHQTSRIRQL